MDQIHTVRRYRSNPVEVAIFSIVTLVLMNSLYHLFYDHANFSTMALTSMKSNPLSEGRQLASTSTSSLLSLAIQCQESELHQETSANRLRLKGPLCGASTENSSENLVKTSIVNTANQFAATVFTDPGTGEFSTDYIPLASGENLIHFELAYQGGKKVSQNIRVTKN